MIHASSYKSNVKGVWITYLHDEGPLCFFCHSNTNGFIHLLQYDCVRSRYHKNYPNLLPCPALGRNGDDSCTFSGMPNEIFDHVEKKHAGKEKITEIIPLYRARLNGPSFLYQTPENLDFTYRRKFSYGIGVMHCLREGYFL